MTDRKQYYRSLLRDIPRAYRDFIDAEPEFACDDGVLEEMIEFVKNEESLTPGKVCYHHYVLIGSPDPLPII